MRSSALFAVLLFTALPPLWAAPLQEASISKIINEVKVVTPANGAHSAALSEVIKNDLGVKTGVKSRAELMFQDQTLTRLGAETYFSFQPGTRDMTLREGTMLLQVPKGLGGAKIHTAAVTASITGTTIMMEYWPGRDVKVLVLEGSLRLSVDGRMGEAVTLLPGKMLLMKPGDKRLPDPVDVDLAKVVKTSALVDPAAFKGKSKILVAPLPSLGLIQKEIVVQTALKGASGLVDTNLLIPGKGNKVLVVTPADLAAAQTVTELQPATPGATGGKSKVEVAAGSGPSSSSSSSSSGGKGSSSESGAEPEPPANKDNSAAFTISPFFLSTLSSSDTLETARPAVLSGAVSRSGGVYYGERQSGVSAARYFFGSDYAALDGAFGTDLASLDGLGVSTVGMAAYRFSSLQLDSAPTVTGYRKNLALSAAYNIGASSSAVAWTLDGLRSLTLTSDLGYISLSNGFYASSGAGVKLLEGYARYGSISVSAPISLPDGAVSLLAGGTGGITLTNLASIDAPFVNLQSAGPVAIYGTIVPGVLNITTPTLVSDVNLFSTGGVLNIGAGGIRAGTNELTGFRTISSVGNVTAAALQASGSIAIGGFVHGPSISLDAPVLSVGGGISANGDPAGTGDAGQITLLGDSVSIDAPSQKGKDDDDKEGKDGKTAVATLPSINGLSANGADSKTPGAPGGNGGTIDIGTSLRPITGNVILNLDVSAQPGKHGPGPATPGGAGGTVSVVAGGTIVVNSKVQVSDPAQAGSGGTIRLESRRTSGAAISVSDSGQLLSLLSLTAAGPGGSVQLLSAGGSITVGKGKIQADRGQILVQNNGATGSIGLNDVNLRGDVVKAGALGANGQLLINGGTISADTLLSLYAGGSNGTVRFQKDTNLSGAGVKNIAGDTVIIDNKRKVNVSGPAATVYTNHANYSGSGGNGSTTGTFTGSGASTQPHASRPAF